MPPRPSIFLDQLVQLGKYYYLDFFLIFKTYQKRYHKDVFQLWIFQENLLSWDDNGLGGGEGGSRISIQV